jgi:uncharacterized BrkB/YihY/UPF0761 family membrane protein
VLDIIEAQILQITKGGNAGLLTFGILGALWSSSSANSAIIDTLNRGRAHRHAAVVGYLRRVPFLHSEFWQLQQDVRVH